MCGVAVGENGEIVQFADTECTGSPNVVNCAGARFPQRIVAAADEQGAAIGVISVTRVETGSLPINHVQLLQTFADQAVIAIENVRLFDEATGSARTADGL